MSHLEQTYISKYGGKNENSLLILKSQWWNLSHAFIGIYESVSCSLQWHWWWRTPLTSRTSDVTGCFISLFNRKLCLKKKKCPQVWMSGKYFISATQTNLIKPRQRGPAPPRVFKNEWEELSSLFSPAPWCFPLLIPNLNDYQISTSVN